MAICQLHVVAVYLRLLFNLIPRVHDRDTAAMTARQHSSVSHEPSIRVKIAHWLLIASIGLLAYGYVAIGIAWIYAAQTSRIPDDIDIARYARTGSGPWDHISDLNQIVGQGMTAPFFATIPAIASLIMRPKNSTVALIAICVLSMLAIVYTHFWLID